MRPRTSSSADPTRSRMTFAVGSRDMTPGRNRELRKGLSDKGVVSQLKPRLGDN